MRFPASASEITVSFYQMVESSRASTTVTVVGASPNTSERVLDAALASFGARGFDATSLDALAGELGIRKQSILYHFGSKEALLDAVVDRAVAELAETLEAALETSGDGWDRVDTVVRTTFRIATRRPEILGIVRELSRRGGPSLVRATEALEPLIKRATEFLEAEMDAGRVRRCDAQLLVMSVYATVMGVATEVELLRAIGMEPSLRSAAIRRREVLSFLHSALT